GYFRADPASPKPPYTIVIPPPNVTGALHLGHALNNTLQDILIRWRRMQGYDALWMPGTDHAGIATQAVVERRLLEEEKKTRHDLGREALVERIWAWKDEYEKRILGQLLQMGCSCDWERTRFTLDPMCARAVRTTFVDLFRDDKIFRGKRLVNWDTHLRTAVADDEIYYEDIQGQLWTIRYPVAGSPDGEALHVATTRPETMLGDTAVAVHPEDGRYKHLIGRSIALPLTGREIPIIADPILVDPKFGTGCVKVTPAHDPNDFEIGGRLGLESVNILNPDGTINENGAQFVGMSREEARQGVTQALAEQNLLGEVTDYAFRVGHCDRCGAVIEPWLSEQWWVSMKELAEPAIEALREGRITVYPDSWRRETIRWLENIHDWNVSRQLWWGHRVPVWYGVDGEMVASKESPGEGFEQEEDILDTWFSSGLWPFATLGWPEENEDLAYFYPTSLLSTAREIMYLWVARMVMMGLRFRDEVPFEKINVHSIVLAEDGTKMSKSKGNVVDPLDLMDEHGTDAVRFGLLYQSSTQDFAYSYERATMGRAFVTKLWNAMRFVSNYPEEVEGAAGPSLPERWILSSLNRTASRYDELLEACEFSEAMRLVYDFAWHEFADWYIEISKSAPSTETPRVLREVLSRILKLLHPVMPFVTEEMWRVLGEEDLLAWQSLPRFDPDLDDPEAEALLERTRRAVSAVRSFRAESKIEGKLDGRVPDGVDREVFISLAGVNPVEDLDGAARATLPAGDMAVEIVLTEDLRRGEVERLRKEIDRVQAEVGRAEGKLSNEKFVERAPAEVVSGEREKLDVNSRMLSTLSRRLEEYLR
ncbi:MAG: valine--tRNA ligase, partial [Actinomycetota bacterium]|nr:valine--tRNA ligase [Actinomycetota bacterium]